MKMVPKGGHGREGRRVGVAVLHIFVKQTHRRTWFSDASFEAVGELCLETEVYWRHCLSEEEKEDHDSEQEERRRESVVYQRSGADGGGDDSSRDDSAQEGCTNEGGRVGADGGGEGIGGVICEGGEGEWEEEVGGMMRNMRVLERVWKWSFQAKRVRGEDYVLDDRITR